MTLLYRCLAAASAMLMLYSSPLAAADALETAISQQTVHGVACELKVKEKYEYYDVEGATVCDLEKQINQHGTRWNDGKTYAAVTSWDLRYAYDTTKIDGKISVKWVKTDVDVVYRLPRRAPCESSPMLSAQWDNYMVNLKHHEFGHKDLTVKIAGELNETLASLQGFSSQEELELEAKRVIDEKLQHLKEVQVAYDHDTRHGVTQGAVLASELGSAGT